MNVDKVIKRYPDTVPVIIKKKETEKCLPDLPNNKCLIPRKFTIGDFIWLLRKKLKLESHKGIFIFVNGILPPNNALMETLYNEHKDPDSFLYITYCSESIFG